MTSAPAARDHRMPDERLWRSLTVSATKTELYAEDLYFRECWSDALDILGAADAAQTGTDGGSRAAADGGSGAAADEGSGVGTDGGSRVGTGEGSRTAGDAAAAALAPLGLLSFKCDGMAGRRAEPTLRYLADQGFSILASAPIRHNRHSMRELWRYNWHVYTTDRLALMTLMHSVGDSLLLIVRDDRYDPAVPGSVRLADLKGSADPEARGPEHLRTVLDPPNKIINFVHVADEPADICREVGIFLDRPERRALLTEIRRADAETATRRAHDEVARLQALLPASDFDLEAALKRVEPATTPDALARLRFAAAGGTRLSWDELGTLLDRSDPAVDFWDFVRIATEVLDADRPASADLLPPSSAAEWRAAAAR
ncbi:hypothetical protein GT045_22410 [Streptomyces sp. SID486]|uniref:hypothetical protein n=1 Tax=Streptomyces sp. SID486 TaxID=2690264 RepID=UPI001371F949|nr:hypothetical protein [Streptomyces sp. SID486]MYX97491.1 hypothetical protein [Streptomyces sp. SID486]